MLLAQHRQAHTPGSPCGGKVGWMHTSARVIVAVYAVLLVAAFAIVPGTAKANMDRPIWVSGDFWEYAVVSGTGPAQTVGTFLIQAEQSVTVPKGTFTTTPLKETSGNGTFTVNYWSAQVGNWVQIGEHDSSGRSQGQFNLTSYNYQGGSFFTSIIFGLPAWIWIILLVVILVAIIGFFAVRRRKPPVRAMPPPPPPMSPQEPMGPEGPPPGSMP